MKKRGQMEFGSLPEIALMSSVVVLNILGSLQVDDRLSWIPHIDNICKKHHPSLYPLKRIKKTLVTQDTLRIACFSMFEPI